MEFISNIGTILLYGVVVWFCLEYLGDFNCWLADKIEPGYSTVMISGGTIEKYLFLTIGFMAFWPKALESLIGWAVLLSGIIGWFLVMNGFFFNDLIKEKIFDGDLATPKGFWLIPVFVVGVLPATALIISLIALGWLLLCLGDCIENVTADKESAYL